MVKWLPGEHILGTDVMEVEFLIEQLRESDDVTKGGVKFDAGKVSYALIPWVAVKAVAQVLNYGAKKYAPRNWELGMDWSRPYDGAVRHLTAWWEGENKDPDTGMSHLWHAATNLFFLIFYEAKGRGTDDRPRTDSPAK
jgi:hypothetical protein